MVEMNRIVEIIENMAPLNTQESWDNSGWQIRLGDGTAENVLVALELNEADVSEAIRQNVQMIVCHHPLIFGAIKKVDNNMVIGNMIVALIRHGISVYATHTPFDKCAGGNNDYLAQLLNLENVHEIPEDESGICRMGCLKEALTVQEMLEHFSRCTGQDIRSYRLVGNPGHKVQTIGMCTGAGSEFMKLAADAGCDLYVTGDVKYHEAQHALELGLTVVDLGHYGSEQIFTENMAEILRDALGSSAEILESEVNLNPFSIIE